MAKKIIFMGTPMFAVPILKSLYQNGYPISDVYTQPPQKSHRGQKINKSPIQGIAETLNLDFRAPDYLKDNNEEYDVFFTKETIKQAQKLFMASLRNNSHTLEHDKAVEGLTVVESWIKEDDKFDKSINQEWSFSSFYSK